MAGLRNLLRRHEFEPAQVRSTLRASASRLQLKDRKLVAAQARRRAEWQDEAWSYFDDVPEIKYSVWFEGNVMAKVRLYVAVRDADDPDADPTPIDEADGIPPALVAQAKAELQRLKGPLGGKSEIVRELNMNLEIAAECYLVGFGARPGPDGTMLPEEWDIKSVSEVEQQGGKYKIKAEPGDTKPRVLDPEQDCLIRIWQRHPRYSLLADCAMRGVLSDCEGALLSANAIKAETKSQMNGGILLLSNNLRADSRRTADEGGEDDEGEATDDVIGEMLYDLTTDPIQDPSSAASVNPAILFGDPVDIETAKHITFARPISGELAGRLELFVNRIARGLNLPVEVVLGHQQTTFANAEQVSEDTYKQHFEPRCLLLTDALTVGFLQPNLLDVNPGQEALIDRIVIWFDPKAMLKPVDPVASSTEGITSNLISSEAWRRVNGWSEDDAPTAEEQLMRLVIHLRTFDPGTTTAILELFGVELDIPKDLPGSGPDSGTAKAGQAAAQRLMALASAAKQRGETFDVAHLMAQVIAEQLEHLHGETVAAVSLPPATRALPAPAQISRNLGTRLLSIDREVRARLVTAADGALDRTLERAGARLRSRAIKASAIRPMTEGVPNRQLAATLGPTVVRAVAADTELIGEDAWAQLEQQFMTWGAQAQQRAIDAVNDVIGFSTGERDDLMLRQSSSLAESWGWLREQLDVLASTRLYGPDPLAPDVGEFDPTSKVPTGLIRQALARAGGATGLTETGTNPYVAVNHGDPLGGIGTGETLMGAVTAGGGEIEAYQWVYGDAYRATNFEPHLDLDGDVFTDFTSEVLVAGDFVGDYYFPGDHDGCVCDIAPVIVAAGETDDSGAT